MIFFIDNYKIKFFGLNVLKIKFKNDCKWLIFFGFLTLKIKSKYAYILSKINQNKDFNLKYIDDEILQIFNYNFKNKAKIEKKNIAILSTRIYDNGGHTKCIINLCKSLKDSYKINFFL